MRTQGTTYQQIADELVYANRGAVHNIVAAALKAHTSEAVKDLQHLEAERLDALQQALWATAMEGDVAAIVRIIQARCRLYGLTGQKSVQAPATPITVGLTDEEVRSFTPRTETGFTSSVSGRLPQSRSDRWVKGLPGGGMRGARSYHGCRDRRFCSGVYQHRVE